MRPQFGMKGFGAGLSGSGRYSEEQCRRGEAADAAHPGDFQLETTRLLRRTER
jgi:hypothetical protein